MDRGYIKLYRKFLENELWLEPRKFSKAEAWIDILSEVRWQHDECSVMIGNQTITCGYGQSLKSILTWASRWRWSEPSVRRFLRSLEVRSMICKESVAKTTRLTVCNFEKYQKSRRQDDVEMTPPRRHGDAMVTTEEERKERKKVKTKSNGNGKSVDLPPWLDHELWSEFLEHRKALRKPMTDYAKNLLFKKVEGFMAKGFNPSELLREAIERGWQTVFEPKEPGFHRSQPTYQPTNRPTVLVIEDD